MEREAALNELKVLDYELSTCKSEFVHGRHTSGFVLFRESKMKMIQETKKQIDKMEKEMKEAKQKERKVQ